MSTTSQGRTERKLHHPEFNELCYEYEQQLLRMGVDYEAVEEFMLLCHPRAMHHIASPQA